MKHFDRILLGILYLVAAGMGACLWFHVRFGFDIFSRAHWRYLSSAQVAGAGVSQWFYISLVAFVITALAGLYIILYPRAPRPERASAPARGIGGGAYVPAPMPGAPAVAVMSPARPPRLELPFGRQMPPPPQSMPIQARAPAPTQGTEYATTARTRQTGGNNPDGHVLPKASSGTRSAAQRIVESAGFIIKPPPPIGRITPDVWAIGADEVLLVGSICPVPGDVIASEGGSSIWKSGRTEFISPVWSMASVQEQLRTLFMETLDEEMISISAFVIIDGGTVVNADAFRAIWNALGVTVFGGINEFAEYMAQNPNRAVASDEAENFREYGEYIDAVAKHFNTN